jgi:hypothetical protein
MYYVSCWRNIINARNWASWSDIPFIMGHAEDELSLVMFKKILLQSF